MVPHYVKEHYAIHAEDKKQTKKVAWSKKYAFRQRKRSFLFPLPGESNLSQVENMIH